MSRGMSAGRQPNSKLTIGHLVIAASRSPGKRWGFLNGLGVSESLENPYAIALILAGP